MYLFIHTLTLEFAWNALQVSGLPNHVLAECSETKAYVRCDNCRTVLLATQLPSHKQHACKGTSILTLVLLSRACARYALGRRNSEEYVYGLRGYVEEVR